MKCPFCIKVCTRCERILVAYNGNFNRQKKGKFGLRNDCIICQKKRQKKYYEENKEEILKHQKEYYEENKEERKEYWRKHYKENEEEIKEKNKQYREKNKEKIKENNKQFYEMNKDYFKQYGKQYYEENKNEILKKRKEYYKNNINIFFNVNNRRRQLEENQGEGITKEQWLEMMEFFEWKCAYSGEYLKRGVRSIDHIIPLSLGGEHEIWNLVPMLINYNCSKQDKNMEDWYMEQDFFDINRLLKIYKWIEYAYKKYNKNSMYFRKDK